MNRRVISLSVLPESVRDGIMHPASATSFGLELVQQGNWMVDRIMEVKEDIFIYQGRYWKHIKTRERHQPDAMCCPSHYISQVFPVHRKTVLYE